LIVPYQFAAQSKYNTSRHQDYNAFGNQVKPIQK